MNWIILKFPTDLSAAGGFAQIFLNFCEVYNFFQNIREIPPSADKYLGKVEMGLLDLPFFL